MSIVVIVIIVIAAFLLIGFIAEQVRGCLSIILGIVLLAGVIALVVAFGPMLLGLLLGLLKFLWGILLWLLSLVWSILTHIFGWIAGLFN